jgi:hypothetical protein
MTVQHVRNQLGEAILETGIVSLRVNEAFSKARANLSALSENLDTDKEAEALALARIIAAHDTIREIEQRFYKVQIDLAAATLMLSAANPDWNAANTQ